MDIRRRAVPLGIVLGLVLSVVFVTGFASGMLIDRSQSSASTAANDENVREFLTAYRLVTSQSYYQPVNRKHLIYAAIDGMLAATGDPHTLFLSPQQNQVADRELNGVRFSGIGAIVGSDQGRLQILAPLPGSPSLRAGLKSGDVITAINGRSTAGMTSDAAVALIHGRSGTLVRLTIQRGPARTFDVLVRRAQIPAVTAYPRVLGNGLGYIDIVSFGNGTDKEVGQALQTLLGHQVRAIILDLRQNPGGYVDAAQEVVSRFVSSGTVAYERSSDHHLQPLPVLHNGAVISLPLAVLVDGGTASAAEITAGALRDLRHAEIVGQRTYGKGSMQSVYALSDGASLRITDRLWLTPKKQSIQGHGIAPDIHVTASPTSSNPDPTLQAAEQYLATKLGR